MVEIIKIKGIRYFYNFLKSMRVFDNNNQKTYFNDEGKCLIWYFKTNEMIFVSKEIKLIYDGDDVLVLIEKFICNNNIETVFITE